MKRGLPQYQSVDPTVSDTIGLGAVGGPRLTMNLDELAETLGLGRTLVRRLAREDALPAPIRVIRVGRRMVVARAAVEDLLSSTPT